MINKRQFQHLTCLIGMILFLASCGEGPTAAVTPPVPTPTARLAEHVQTLKSALNSEDTGARSPISIWVLAAEPWVDTGIDLPINTSVTITATGVIDVGTHDHGYTPSGVVGATCHIGRTGHCIAPGQPWQSLVGRIGDGAPFYIGKTSTFVTETSGRLYLGINDEIEHFEDNSGQWNVTISLGKQQHSQPIQDTQK